MQYKKRNLLQTEKNNQRSRLITLGIVAVVIVLVVVILISLLSNNRKVSAAKLPCIASQDIRPFGNYILYYDGVTLFCLNSNGTERWDYTLGGNASFSCSDKYVVAWNNSQLHILNQNGQPTYNENLANNIQFAKAGSKYVGIVMGTDVGPTLEIKDMQGTTIDTETTAYSDMIITDIGFFDNGEYLWTTSLDIYGTVNNVVMHTYKVNMTNSGEIALGEHLVYNVVFANDQLHVISTEKVRRFDYRGSEDTEDSVLVYGWKPEDYGVADRKAMLLFSLTNNSAAGMNQLRLLHGNTDKRFTMPSFCVGAALFEKSVYAFASDSIYRAGINAQRFEAIALPKSMDSVVVTDFLGMLNNGVAILCAADGSVYAVTVP